VSADAPLVSVVTPTWARHELLLERCVPSVQAQDYPAVEHVIACDGPDGKLRQLIAELPPLRHPIRFAELPGHQAPPNFGSLARLHGISISVGAYITYCDDDDSLRPEHCRLMALALDASPGSGFAVSRMLSHAPHGDIEIGWGALACGNVGTPMLMHRREILEHATWGPPSMVEDWEVVVKWLNAGIGYVNVDATTSDVWPSIFSADGKTG
jgi:glycosyltransferase involved in cell wall biosynthesis